MKRTNQWVLTVALIAALVVPAAHAQVATMSYGSSALSWSPQIENEGFVLTVAGNGQYFRKEFAAGESPVFSLYDNAGEPLADGFYNWELTPVLSRTQIERGNYAPGRVSADGSYQLDQRAPQAPVDSGTFQILNGAIVDPSLSEAGAATEAGGLVGVGGGGGKGANEAGGPVANFVAHTGSVTIDGSLCLGFDCPATASFSDTTFLLTENNTRIKYDDTSVVAGFPNNDWELQANSSSSGGGNFFAINDCGTSSGGGCADDPLFKVTAGAPANSLFVDSAGDVGLNTSNPVLELHIKDGDSPGIRLEQDGSSGFTQQVWDLSGNETNFFIRDATNGSALPFRIQPGTAGNTLFLDADDRVGIATTSPDAKLDVNGQLLVNRDNGSPTPLGDLHIFRDGTDTASMVMQNSATRWQFNATNTGGGQFEIFNGIGSVTPFKITEGAPGNLMTLDSTGVLISGVVQHPPDYVFEPDYDLKPIVEHAEYMWENKHLPAVGPGGTEINLVGHQYGVLEELEVAHIYIAQLNERLAEREAQLDEVLKRLAELEAKVQQ